MELEELRAAYQRAKDACPRADAHAIMLATKREAEKRERDFKRQQRTQILCVFMSLGFMTSLYRREGPELANAGLILMLLCLALMMAGSIMLRYRLQKSHPWLPDEEFEMEQREKIVAQIAVLRRNRIWFFIPFMLGFLTWQVALANSFQMVVALVVIAVVASAGAIWLYRRKLRNELLPVLEDIDRELEELRERNK